MKNYGRIDFLPLVEITQLKKFLLTSGQSCAILIIESEVINVKRMTIMYLDEKTCILELPDKMVKDWENGDCFMDEILYQARQTNQIPKINSSNIYAGLITIVETANERTDGPDGLKIDGDSL